MNNVELEKAVLSKIKDFKLYARSYATNEDLSDQELAGVLVYTAGLLIGATSLDQEMNNYDGYTKYYGLFKKFLHDGIEKGINDIAC